MHIQFLFALLSSTLPLASAVPQAASPTITPPDSYYLRSRVVGDDHDDNDGNNKHEKRGVKDGLWVSCYNTGTQKLPAFHSKPFVPVHSPTPPNRFRNRFESS